MKGFEYEKRRGSSIKTFAALLAIFLIIIAIGYSAYKIFSVDAPVIEGLEAFNQLPLDKTITLNGRNLKSINISIIQNGKETELLSDTPDGGKKIYALQIKPRELKLTDGPAKVVVKAKAGILKKVEHEINSTIDTVPPALEVLKTPEVIHQGSTGFALLRAGDASSLYVSNQGKTFKAFKTAAKEDSGVKQAMADYIVFFPVPLDIKDNRFFAVAEDAAGNKIVRSLPSRFMPVTYKTSSITIGDAFINTVIAPLLNTTEISDPVKAFKTVNEEMREKNRIKLDEITQTSSPEILWRGGFLQLKNGQVMATYGDKRTYLYNGSAISSSVHLGYDLASLAHSPVEAANNGVVKYAGELGIYGNAVIIDHGLGVMSLYGHLSTIMVKEGQSVNKGDIIAKTGSTGLAGGDHLHFGILVQGYEVSPLFWWDEHWIKDNILSNLEAN
ncbi:MAG: M23 family metallopeptidase [Nitrospirae bacterium]|nr:M23 family metallopeptidase [Nitrospirota bacterium]